MNKMYARLTLICLILSTLLGSAANLEAQMPRYFTYQAYLTNANDIALDYPNGVTMTAKLYNSESLSDNTPVWIEIQEVKIISGYLNTYLGQLIPLDLKFDRPYFLEIVIGNNPPFKRTKLTSAPYSMNSLFSDTSKMTRNIPDNIVTQSKLATGVKALPWGVAGGDLTGVYPLPSISSDSLLKRIPAGSLTQNMVVPTLQAFPKGVAGGDLSGTYPQPQILNGAVTEQKIATDAVTEIKVMDNAIGVNKLNAYNQKVYFWDPNAKPASAADNGRFLYYKYNSSYPQNMTWAPAPTDGSYPFWKNGAFEWGNPQQYSTAPPLSGTGTPTDPITLYIPNVLNKQVLQYNSSWGAGYIDAGNLNTSNTVGSATNNYALTWDNSTGQMKWSQASVTSVATGAPLTGNGFTSTITLAPIGTNEILSYSGSSWTNGKIYNGLFADNTIDLESIGAVNGTGGQFLRINNGATGLEWADASASTAGMLVGNGSVTNPIAINETGVMINQVMYYNAGWKAGLLSPFNLNTSNTVSSGTDGYSLIWDNTANKMKWSQVPVNTSSPLNGNGTTSPITLAAIGNNQILYYNGSWQSGKVANGLITNNSLNLETIGAPSGTARQVLRINSAGNGLEWADALTSTAGMLVGNGSTTSPIAINETGVNSNELMYYNAGWKSGLLTPANINTSNTVSSSTDGFSLVWDNASNQLKWSQSTVSTNAPLTGNGISSPLTLASIGNNQILYYNGSWQSGKIGNGLFAGNTINLENIGVVNGTSKQILRINAAGDGLEWADATVNTAGMLTGTGTSTNPIVINETGVNTNDVMYYNAGWKSGKLIPGNLDISNSATLTTDGYYLQWDNSLGKMKWNILNNTNTAGMIIGNGTVANPIAINETGVNTNEVMYFNAGWKSALLKPVNMNTSNAVSSSTDAYQLTWDNSANQMKWQQPNKFPYYANCASITELQGLSQYTVINYTGTASIMTQTDLPSGTNGQIIYIMVGGSNSITILTKSVAPGKYVMLIYSDAWRLPQ
ncbi:MAG: hypothetical protein HW421_2974 [Ignavibacteria bacterium]|nr:hypothetical protein [Ignavibacteria bacterium]